MYVVVKAVILAHEIDKICKHYWLHNSACGFTVCIKVHCTVHVLLWCQQR